MTEIDWPAVPRSKTHRQFGGRMPWFCAGGVTAIAVDPRGRYVLAAGERGLHLFDATTGVHLRAFENVGNGGSMHERVAFSTDGREVFAFTGVLFAPLGIGVWNVETGALMRRLDGGQVRAIDAERGLVLARGLANSYEAELWDLGTGTARRMSGEDLSAGLGAATFAGERIIAISSCAGTARCWDLARADVVWTQAIDGFALAAPRDGEWFAQACFDGEIFIRDAASGLPRFKLADRTLGAKAGGVFALDVDLGGHHVMAAWGTTLVVWDIERRSRILSRAVPPYTVARFAPDGSFIAAASASGWMARIPMNALAAPERSMGAGGRDAVPHEDPVCAIAFRAGGGVVSVDEAGGIAVWSVDGTLLRTMGLETGRTEPGSPRPLAKRTALALSPDGRLAIVARANSIGRAEKGRTFVWDLEAGVALRELPIAEAVRSVVWPTRGPILLATSRGTLASFEPRSWRSGGAIGGGDGKFFFEVAAVPGEPDVVLCGGGIVGTPNAALLMSAGGKIKRTFALPYRKDDEILAVATTSRHGLALTGDGDVVVWDLSRDNKTCIFELEVGTTPGSGVGSAVAIAIHPDGRRVALATSRRETPIQLWDLGTGRPLGILDGHEAAPLVVGFHPDGTSLVSGGADRSLRVWPM